MFRLLWFAWVLIALLLAGCRTPRSDDTRYFQTGESVVLAGLEPARLAFSPKPPHPIVVRSTYLGGLPQTVVYQPGRDYLADGDGYLFIVDRKKEMIIRGGENIYPKELEEIMYGHPRVLEVAVVGVKDEIYGEEVMACLVPRQGETIDTEEFRSWCRANMASYKVPKYVSIRQQLPKNILGKILKKELKAALKGEGLLK